MTATVPPPVLDWPQPLPAPDQQTLPLRTETDIQGNVLAAFNKDRQMLLFVSFTGVHSARAWLTAMRPRLSDNAGITRFNERFSAARRAAGADPENQFAVWANISFTAHGIGILDSAAIDQITRHTDVDGGVQHWLDGAADAGVLGAVGDSTGTNSPAHWLFGAEGPAVDAVVCVAADRPADLEVELARQRELLATHHLPILFEQPGETLPGLAAGHEHFGFKDGISQPGVFGYDQPSADDPEEVAGKAGTDLLAAGTFVLGYPRDDGTTVRVPKWMYNGSFLVTRRLAQDVPGFWSGVESQHAAITGSGALAAIPTPDALAAKLVGRWRSGTPTDHAPTADNRAGQAPAADNDFDFEADPSGFKTPECAHIRKVYPRKGAEHAAIEVTEEGTKPHRILRRGIPFGPPFQPTAGRGDGVDAERGLVFQCYQSSLQDGFVFLQQAWVNFASFPDPNTGNDSVIGLASDVTIPVPGCPQTLSFAQFVKTEGAVFALTPPLSTIDALAAGHTLPFN
jgi:Dyp-type peroxidase family